MRAVLLVCVAAVALTGCQATRDPAPRPPPPPPVEVVEPNMILALELRRCGAPPCPMGTAEDLRSGRTTIIYDFDLLPAGLNDRERGEVARRLWEEPFAVEGYIEQRYGFLGVQRPVEVAVVTGVAGPLDTWRATHPTARPRQ